MAIIISKIDATNAISNIVPIEKIPTNARVEKIKFSKQLQTIVEILLRSHNFLGILFLIQVYK